MKWSHLSHLEKMSLYSACLLLQMIAYSVRYSKGESSEGGGVSIISQNKTLRRCLLKVKRRVKETVI